MKLQRDDFRGSVLSIIGANLVPLVGVLAVGWSVNSLMTIYWIETGLYAAMVLLKTLTARGTDDPAEFPDTDDFFFEWSNLRVATFYTVFFAPFWLTAGGIIQGAGLLILDSVMPLAISILGFAIAQVGRLYSEHIRTGQYKQHGPLTFGKGLFTRIFAIQYVFLAGVFIALFFESPLVLVLILVSIKAGVDIHEHREQICANMCKQQDTTAAK